MRKLFLLLFLSSALGAQCQKLLKGVVLDAEKNKPVPSASIFLNNTSIGITADAEGRFELYVPSGRYDLIVSSIGFETFNQTIVSSQLQDFFTIKLKIKAPDLQTVVIEPYEKNGWEKWGKLFLDDFIGTSDFAYDCRIKNKEVIKFRNSKKTGVLSAYASEPLLIENKGLGYVIHYQLESFSYNFKTRYLLYTGYPFFEEMKGGAGKEKKWKKRREEVYYGSMLHFMRSLYRNTLSTEGFEMHALKKIPNAEKQRVKIAQRANIKRTTRPDGTVVISPTNEDSSAYYNEVLRQSDYIDILNKNIIPADSVAFAVNKTTAGMDFTDYLMINYKNGITPPEYRQQNPESSTAMVSQITLINNRPIEIEANGSYYSPEDLMTEGYWAWSEKAAMMLPFDYKPGK